MKSDMVGAVAQNEEKHLWLLADVAEKCSNHGYWRTALVNWENKKRRSGVTRPRKRRPNVRATAMKKAKWRTRLFSKITGGEEQAKEGEEEIHGGPKKIVTLVESDGANGSRPRPTMPEGLKNKIEELQGYDEMMVIEKKLTKTDTERHCNRLSIPKGKMVVEFLTNEEQVNMEKKTDDGQCEGMNVVLIEPNLKQSTISLKRWLIGERTTYVLCKTWIAVAKSNKLSEGNTIQVWSFRVSGSLGLALVKLRN